MRVLRKAVRDQRWPALAWGGALALLALVTAAGWSRAYPDDASRLLLAQQLRTSLSVANMFYGEPHHIETLAGFLSWRGLGLYPVLLGLFMAFAATGITRGAEQRGELDVVLAAPLARWRLFVELAEALFILLLVAGAFVLAGLLLAGPAAKQSVFSPASAVLATTNLLLVTAFFAAVGLLAAQLFQTRRGAALFTGGLLFASHIWANLGLVATGLSGVRRLSPTYLYQQSTPLVDGHLDAWSVGLLAILTAGVGSLACRLFVQRDVGAVGWSLIGRRAAALAHLGRRLDFRRGAASTETTTATHAVVFVHTLRGGAVGGVIWGLALGAYAALLTGLAPAVKQSLLAQQSTRDFLAKLQPDAPDPTTLFLSVAVFGLLPVLLTVYAATLAAGWAGEERAGRLEVELAYPISRARYFWQRLAAAVAALLPAIALVGACFFVTAALAGVSLDAGRAVTGVLLLAPLSGIVVAFGFAVSAWRPAYAAAACAAAVAVSYFLDLLATLLGLLGAIREVSIFHLYGQPLTAGVRWGGLAALLLLSAAFAATGGAWFSRRDIER